MLFSCARTQFSPSLAVLKSKIIIVSWMSPFVIVSLLGHVVSGVLAFVDRENRIVWSENPLVLATCLVYDIELNQRDFFLAVYDDFKTKMYSRTKLERNHSQLSLQKRPKSLKKHPSRIAPLRGGGGGYAVLISFKQGTLPYHILPNVYLIYVHQTIKLKWFLKYVQSFFSLWKSNFSTCTECLREIFHSVFASSWQVDLLATLFDLTGPIPHLGKGTKAFFYLNCCFRDVALPSAIGWNWGIPSESLKKNVCHFLRRLLKITKLHTRATSFNRWLNEKKALQLCDKSVIRFQSTTLAVQRLTG